MTVSDSDNSPFKWKHHSLGGEMWYGSGAKIFSLWEKDYLLTLRKRSGLLQISKFLKCHLVRPDD